MKKSYNSKHYLKALLFSLLIVRSIGGLFAQGTANPTYATAETPVPVPSGGTIVDNNGGAISATQSGNTVLTTGFSGFGFGTGTSTPTYTLKFAAVIPANTTTYIRVSNNTGGNIALNALNAAGTSVSTTSAPYFDPSGAQYITITPTAAYQSVAISISSTYALTVGTTQTVTVFYALYYPTFNTNLVTDCGSGIYTYQTGGVVNPNLAINTSTSDYSAFTVAIVSTAQSQTILFNGPSNAGDNVRLTIENPLSLTASVLQGITFQAYNGTTAVGNSQTATNILNAAGVLGQSGPHATDFDPASTLPFDRITISTTGLSVGIGDVLRIYNAQRVPAAPAIVDNSACNLAGSTDKTVSVQSSQSAISGLNLTYSWFASITTSGPAAFTSTNTNPNVDVSSLTTGSHTYYVSASKTGCTLDSSAITAVTFNVLNSCAVLPAVGLTLSGSFVTGKPVLTWSTLQEQNTSYFSVESSDDGVTFTSLGKVAAAGTSASPSSYSFTDVTSTGSVVYYRVKLVDIDGDITYSNIFSLRLSGSALAKIYPNPVTNVVNIETGAAGTYVAELFTIDGRKLTSTQLATASGLVTLTIDRANVLSGVYLLKITSKSSSTSTYNTILVK